MVTIPEKQKSKTFKQGGRGKGQGGEVEGGRQCPPHHRPRQNVL